MEIFLLIARLFLALIFGVAGVAKAFDRAGSRQAFIGFGLSEKMASLLGWGLPFVEIAVAVALIPLNTAWWAAISALALLLIFAAGIALSLARGQSPDCRCFGQLHSEPVSRVTFARNLALASIAGIVVAEGRGGTGLSALSWLSELRTSEVVNLILGICLIGLLAAAITFLKRMLKQQAALLGGIEAIRLALGEEGEPAPVIREGLTPPQDGLPLRAAAPGFSLSAIGGGKMSLDDLLGYRKPVLLLFVGPNCWGCKLLLPAARAWQRDFPDLVTVAVLSQGTTKENQAKMVRYELSHVLDDGDSRVADYYQAQWTPASVLINADGHIASRITYGDNAIREWFRDLLASGQLLSDSSVWRGRSVSLPQVSVRYSVREIGESAPRFSLSDLSGKIIDVEDFAGGPTLLLFWHARCQYCKAMADDLREWEEDAPAGAPKLVFVASGEVEDIHIANREFKSPTLLDPAFDIAPLFGTKVTPSAILLDDEGRIASGLAIGTESVRVLIGIRKTELRVMAQI